MLRAIIIDDETSGLISLELMIRKHVKDVKVVATTTEPLEGIELINDYRPDVVFLDVQMPEINGFSLLDRIEFRDFHLIFTTAHEKYALQALKKKATDYLLKPIDTEDLVQALEKVKKKMTYQKSMPDIKELMKEVGNSAVSRIAVTHKNGIEFLVPDDIIYIEASSNRSVVVKANGEELEGTKSLKEYEEQLNEKEACFMRIHNSYIININYVSRYIKEDGGYAVMQGKKSIPVSKAKKDDFLRVINFKM